MVCLDPGEGVDLMPSQLHRATRPVANSRLSSSTFSDPDPPSEPSAGAGIADIDALEAERWGSHIPFELAVQAPDAAALAAAAGLAHVDLSRRPRRGRMQLSEHLSRKQRRRDTNKDSARYRNMKKKELAQALRERFVALRAAADAAGGLGTALSTAQAALARNERENSLMLQVLRATVTDLTLVNRTLRDDNRMLHDELHRLLEQPYPPRLAIPPAWQGLLALGDASPVAARDWPAPPSPAALNCPDNASIVAETAWHGDEAAFCCDVQGPRTGAPGPATTRSGGGLAAALGAAEAVDPAAPAPLALPYDFWSIGPSSDRSALGWPDAAAREPSPLAASNLRSLAAAAAEPDSPSLVHLPTSLPAHTW